jgi:DNA-binding PadR family transcriptional regulator
LRRQLTPTSYVVLGLLSAFGPATSYDLKKRAADTIGNFWIFAHSQLYDEPARLAEQGLVTREQEQGGRRRRVYQVTEAGRSAVRDWLATPTPGRTEVRDPGLLKLFFGALGSRDEMAALARDQHTSHHERVSEYETLRAEIAGFADRWQLAALDLGIRYEHTVEEYWRGLYATLIAADDA